SESNDLPKIVLPDTFAAISRQRRRIKESPIAKGVQELVNGVNREALEGKGKFEADIGERPTDIKFSLSWEGAITKKQVIEVPGQEFTFSVSPFNLSISTFLTEANFHGFKVTAKYLPGNAEPIEVGRTARLDVGELQPIVRS